MTLSSDVTRRDVVGAARVGQVNRHTHTQFDLDESPYYDCAPDYKFAVVESGKNFIYKIITNRVDKKLYSEIVCQQKSTKQDRCLKSRRRW